MNDGEALQKQHTWPPGRVFANDEAVAAACVACGETWRVHESLAGFRLRCACGAWIDVPPPKGHPPVTLAGPAPAADANLPTQRRMPRRHAGDLVELAGDEGETLFTPIPGQAPMAPGTVRRASAVSQARWTDRTLLEFAALLFALLGPQLLAFWMANGREAELLLPFAAIASGVLVAIVVATTGPYARLGLRAAEPRFFGEAVLVAGLGYLAALAWVAFLRYSLDGADFEALDELSRRLGAPMSLFVIAVAPAVLEEVLFRGVLQGRLLALMGRWPGLVTTAAAFAICHGQPAVLPIHFGLGLYLGVLRERSGSLLPGMLTHLLYNGTIVLLSV